MSDTTKQIQEWQEKVRSSFGEEGKMYQYLFETMDNFYYRYLENTETKNLRTQKLGPHLWGAQSLESNMVDALKIKNQDAKKGIMELAKSVPKAQIPMVRYSITVEIKELKANRGLLVFQSEINWGFPDFKSGTQALKKSVTFNYDDVGQFRKHLALKLEEISDIFS